MSTDTIEEAILALVLEGRYSREEVDEGVKRAYAQLDLLHHTDCDTYQAYVTEGIHWDCSLDCSGDLLDTRSDMSEYHEVPGDLPVKGACILPEGADADDCTAHDHEMEYR